MNKLLIPNGGMPFEGDDLLFMQQGLREAINSSMRLFGEPYGGNIILNGLDYEDDGTNLIISEGFVLFGYEILHFPQTNLATGTSANNVSIRLEVIYDTNGLDLFADGNNKNTYEVRHAKAFSGLQDSPNELVLSSAPRMKDEIYNIVLSRRKMSSISTFIGTWQGTQVIRQKFAKTVRLSGKVSNGDAGTAMFNLAIGFRPSTVINLPVAISRDPNFGLLNIQPNGDVTVFTFPSITFSTTQFVYLDGVTFTVA